MKKIKFLSSLVVLASTFAVTTPLITSCGNKTDSQVVNPIIDEETSIQFENIKTNCAISKDSTIEFTCKKDQELDASSVEIRVAGIKIKADQDFKVQGNKITIYAKALTNTIVNVKASPKFSHVVDTLKASWVLKPLMQYDEVTSKDIKVELVYKDGQKEPLAWNTGYKIYNIVDDEKIELKNFDTTPFVYEKVNVSYNFQIEYVTNPEIKIEVKDIVVVKPYAEAFYIRYAQCLERFEETKDKYGWAHFENGAKFKGESIKSAAIFYDIEDGKALADFKDANDESIHCNRWCIGGNTLNSIKSFIDKHSDIYVPTFTNTKDTFGFELKTAGNAIKVVFDKNTYVKSFDYGTQEGEYAGTNFNLANFDLYKKTATIKAKTYSEISPVERINITTSKGGNYIYDADGESTISGGIYLRNEQGYYKKGKIVIYNQENVPIYTSDNKIINTTYYPIEGITIDSEMWKSIEHDDNLTVKFNVSKQIHISLDSSLATDYILFVNASNDNSIYEDGINQSDAGFVLKRKAGTEVKTFNGKFVLKCKDQHDETIEIARTDFNEQSVVEPVGNLRFINNTWKDILLTKDVTEATLSFVEGKAGATIVKGENLGANFGTVTCPTTLEESKEAVPMRVSWTTPIEKESKFALMSADGNNIYSCLVQPGQTQVDFDFLPEWFNKVKAGDQLTFEIKKEANLEVSLEEGKEVFTMFETWGRQTPIIYIVDTFKYVDNTGEQWTSVNWSLKLTNWTVIKQVGEEWELWLDSHTVRTGWNPGYFELELYVATPDADVLGGSEYEFTLNFEFETSKSYRKYVFDGFRIKFVEWQPIDK